MDSLDPTTNLLDRRSLDVRLVSACSEAKAASCPLGTVFVDVDRFKNVNDQHGHQKGDEVLAEVARRLSLCTKGKGEVYRYGGEELVIVLPNHDLNETLALAERCRVTLERDSIVGLTITASFGVSVFPDFASSPEDLIKTADRAMYDAKKRGRNLVRYHDEPVTEPDCTPKVVARKEPDPGTLTEDQLAEMRRLHFKHREVECPNDGAYMITRQIQALDQEAAVVFARCPQCGLSVRF